jgi:ankyrin repeat protein
MPRWPVISAPLMAAAWEGYTEIVEQLVKHGADVHAVNAEQRSALMLAESEGHWDTVKVLQCAAKSRQVRLEPSGRYVDSV